MRYVSIDIETTGLDPATCQIIQFGAVLEDTSNYLPLEELPTFETLVSHQVYSGTPYALAMHKEIFSELAKKEGESTKKIVKHYQLANEFNLWLTSNGIGDIHVGPIAINVAGKNFGTFDKLFLEKLPKWELFVKIRQRILDPAMLYWDPNIDDTLPNMEECKKRAGFTSTVVAHTALEDAMDVIQLLRYKNIK